MRGKTPYEFRTTVIKSLLSFDDIREIGREITGAKTHYLQKFVSTKTLNPSFLRKTTYNDSEFEEMRTIMNTFVDTCFVR
jgi:pyruvate formate lyase activating enzyme